MRDQSHLPFVVIISSFTNRAVMGKASDHALLNIESERLSFLSCISAPFSGMEKNVVFFCKICDTWKKFKANSPGEANI